MSRPACRGVRSLFSMVAGKLGESSSSQAVPATGEAGEPRNYFTNTGRLPRLLRFRWSSLSWLASAIPAFKEILHTEMTLRVYRGQVQSLASQPAAERLLAGSCRKPQTGPQAAAIQSLATDGTRNEIERICSRRGRRRLRQAESTVQTWRMERVGALRAPFIPKRTAGDPVCGLVFQLPRTDHFGHHQGCQQEQTPNTHSQAQARPDCSVGVVSDLQPMMSRRQLDAHEMLIFV